MDELEPSEIRQISSADDIDRLYRKKEKEARVKREARNQDLKLAAKQIEMLTEANDLATKAHIEAQQSKAESEKSAKRAFYANVIATASLLVAIASLIYVYVSSGN
ncbi:hypothetical protein D1BOALGB6SA_5974 [Olavius sp. associated proteobacterium Delta 1]|nr:hypothetical protein D1BOALGB6SA_5974 [Olavius sp. associated proteobacterium Delta 1]